MSDFKPRDQVVYKAHGQKEYGFVERVQPHHEGEDTIYCRFWRELDDSGRRSMRTRANAEGCRPVDLERFNYGAMEAIDILCDAMGWAP